MPILIFPAHTVLQREEPLTKKCDYPLPCRPHQLGLIVHKGSSCCSGTGKAVNLGRQHTTIGTRSEQPRLVLQSNIAFKSSNGGCEARVPVC
jgi:hypothetical protein